MSKATYRTKMVEAMAHARGQCVSIEGAERGIDVLTQVLARANGCLI